MKKYIRTKDGIYEVEDEIFAPGGEDEPNELWFKVVGKAELINSIRIVNQTDTIEELCDGFYLDLGGEFNDTYLRRKDKFEFLKELTFDYMRRDIKVILYAFIKTSKGLIYVAKMDAKGELLLL